ncbi:hypothetical protein PENTCL1PPCAC_19537, partial [Pristionchus entomophagus]
VFNILIQMLVIYNIQYFSHLLLQSSEIVEHAGLWIDISLQNHSPHVVVAVSVGVVALAVYLILDRASDFEFQYDVKTFVCVGRMIARLFAFLLILLITHRERM